MKSLDYRRGRQFSEFRVGKRNSFGVKMSKNSEATLDAIADQQYLDDVAAGQQQQQLKKAQ